MLYQVTAVEFDFDEDNAPNEDGLIALRKFSMEGLWEVNNLGDLLEEITNLTGWCVSHIEAIPLEGF